MEKVKLVFMVKPEELADRAYVEDGIDVKIVDPDAAELEPFLDQSGKRLAEEGFTFIFEKETAGRLIDAEVAIAKECKIKIGRKPKHTDEEIVETARANQPMTPQKIKDLFGGGMSYVRARRIILSNNIEYVIGKKGRLLQTKGKKFVNLSDKINKIVSVFKSNTEELEATEITKRLRERYGVVENKRELSMFIYYYVERQYLERTETKPRKKWRVRGFVGGVVKDVKIVSGFVTCRRTEKEQVWERCKRNTSNKRCKAFRGHQIDSNGNGLVFCVAIRKPTPTIT